MSGERHIEVHALHWRGVDIEITFEPQWLGIEMRERQGRERIALHQEQFSFWSKLCRAVDITGGTRRRHQATRRALVAEHREERDVLARVSRASWIALKHAVRERYAPSRTAVVASA